MLSDAQFWAVVNSQRFQKKFRGQHPLLPDNGGVDFYNVQSLKVRIDHAKDRLAAASDPKNRALSQRFLNTLNSWLLQVQWVNDNPLYVVD